MTIQEMHIAFKIGYDKIDSLNYPDLLPEEIDFLINQAQDAFVKQRYGVNNLKRQSFEETQKRTEDLKNVVTTAILTPLPNTSENITQYSRFVVLPDGTFPTLNPYPESWFIIQEQTEVSYVGCDGNQVTEKVYTKAIQHDDFSKSIHNPFAKPTESKILRLMENGKVELIAPSNVTITGYYVRYIKKPVRVDIANSVDCELSEHTHQEIVNMAVSIALEGIESKRVQTFDPITLNKQE